MYGARLSERALRTLEGATSSSHAEEDREALRRTLWELAPWQLAPGRSGKLALIPHQRSQVKAWIVWRSGTIDLENTGHADPRVREAACLGFTVFSDGHKMARGPLEQRLSDTDPASSRRRRRRSREFHGLRRAAS
jgi:hypothetical protein